MEFVKDMLNAIGNGVGKGVLDTIKQSPAEFNKTLYNLSGVIASDVGKPIASAVLSVVVILQLIHVSNQAEGDKQTGVKLIAITMIECALLILFAQNATLLLSGIDGIGDWAMDAVDKAASVSTGDSGQKLGDMVGDRKLSALDTGLSVVLLLIPYLVSMVGGIVVIVVVYLRFIQLYLMTGFAPVGVAFFGNEATRPWGIGYFRKYAETVLQTVVLFLAIAFYQQLNVSHAGKLADGQSLASWIVANFGQLILASVLLISVVGVSGRVAKAILGE